MSAVGLASSLGHGPAACAAARAGISRPRRLETYRFTSRVDCDLEYPVGHPANIAMGFEGTGRLLVLARAALHDLWSAAGLASQRLGRVGLFLALPDPARTASGFDLIMDDEMLKARQRIAATSDTTTRARTMERLIEALLTAADLPVTPLQASPIVAGHTGFTVAVSRAQLALEAHQIDQAVVGAVDCLLDTETVAWLDETERLKTASRPAGLQPGEGAVFVLVENERTAAGLGRPGVTSIVASSIGEEMDPLLSGRPALGRALASTLLGLPPDALPGADAWLVIDHNGESYRAQDWGHALVRLLAEIPELAQPRVSYPAIAFGDTGAASGAIACAMVDHAFRRGHAPNRTAHIVSSSDGPERAVLVLRRT